MTGCWFVPSPPCTSYHPATLMNFFGKNFCDEPSAICKDLAWVLVLVKLPWCGWRPGVVTVAVAQLLLQQHRESSEEAQVCFCWWQHRENSEEAQVCFCWWHHRENSEEAQVCFCWRHHCESSEEAQVCVPWW